MAAGPAVTIFGARQEKAHLAFLTRFRCLLCSPRPPAATLSPATPGISTPHRNGQNIQKARSSSNTKWQPGPWSQFAAHVKTKLTSHSSRVLGPHHKVLIHMRLPCDTALPSETPGDSPPKTRKYHFCFRFWQRASCITFSKAGLRSVSHLHLSGSASCRI